MYTFFSNINRKTILLGAFLVVSSLLMISCKDKSKEGSEAVGATPNANALGKLCFYVLDDGKAGIVYPIRLYKVDTLTGQETLIDSLVDFYSDEILCNQITDADIQSKKVACLLLDVGTVFTYAARTVNSRGGPMMVGEPVTVSSGDCTLEKIEFPYIPTPPTKSSLKNKTTK